MQAYHDEEWGVPEYDSRALWEKLMLDGFQAGLSWATILRKREAFRKAFNGFDPNKVARFTEKDIARLLEDPGIVRSRAKIEATINGARIYLAMEKNGEDFAKYIWKLAGGKQIVNRGPVPVSTPLSEEISKALKKLGFKFVGSGDRLRLDAGHRHCQRPQRRLLSAQGVQVRKNQVSRQLTLLLRFARTPQRCVRPTTFPC